MPDPRVAVIQFRPRKAEYAENLRRIGAVFTQVAGLGKPPDIVVFPEAATSGYFLEGGVREVAVPAGTPADQDRGEPDLSPRPHQGSPTRRSKHGARSQGVSRWPSPGTTTARSVLPSMRP